MASSLIFSIWKMGRGVVETLCGIWAAPWQTPCLGDPLTMEDTSLSDFRISLFSQVVNPTNCPNWGHVDRGKWLRSGFWDPRGHPQREGAESRVQLSASVSPFVPVGASWRGPVARRSPVRPLPPPRWAPPPRLSRKGPAQPALGSASTRSWRCRDPPRPPRSPGPAPLGAPRAAPPGSSGNSW